MKFPPGVIRRWSLLCMTLSCTVGIGLGVVGRDAGMVVFWFDVNIILIGVCVDTWAILANSEIVTFGFVGNIGVGVVGTVENLVPVVRKITVLRDVCVGRRLFFFDFCFGFRFGFVFFMTVAVSGGSGGSIPNSSIKYNSIALSSSVFCLTGGLVGVNAGIICTGGLVTSRSDGTIAIWGTTTLGLTRPWSTLPTGIKAGKWSKVPALLNVSVGPVPKKGATVPVFWKLWTDPVFANGSTAPALENWFVVAWWLKEFDIVFDGCPNTSAVPISDDPNVLWLFLLWWKWDLLFIRLRRIDWFILFLCLCIKLCLRRRSCLRALALWLFIIAWFLRRFAKISNSCLLAVALKLVNNLEFAFTGVRRVLDEIVLATGRLRLSAVFDRNWAFPRVWNCECLVWKLKVILTHNADYVDKRSR